MVVFGDGGGGEIALLCLRVYYGQLEEKGFSFTRKFKFLNV
jgi:hypothetical protein